MTFFLTAVCFCLDTKRWQWYEARIIVPLQSIVGSVMPSAYQSCEKQLDLSTYFHLPEKEVAKKLGMCLTSLKKICRQNGINRWPYRKVRPRPSKI